MAKHEIDVTSMVFGLLFAGGAGVWALVRWDVVSWPDASRIFPIMLVVAGLLGLIGTVRRGRSRTVPAGIGAPADLPVRSEDAPHERAPQGWDLLPGEATRAGGGSGREPGQVDDPRPGPDDRP